MNTYIIKNNTFSRSLINTLISIFTVLVMRLAYPLEIPIGFLLQIITFFARHYSCPHACTLCYPSYSCLKNHAILPRLPGQIFCGVDPSGHFFYLAYRLGVKLHLIVDW